MNQILKIVASFAVLFTLLACEQKGPEAPSSELEPEPKELNQPEEVRKKLSSFEQEIQRMLAGEEGDEAVLRKFLENKPKENNGRYLREGVERFVAQHGSKPEKKPIIDTLIKLNRINVKMRNEEALEDIEEALADQLRKEQGR